MTRTEKAITGTFPPVPLSFQHIPVSGKPTPPDISTLPPEDQDRINIWIAAMQAGTVSADMTANASPALTSKFAEYTTYFGSSAYQQWAWADIGSRVFQWRMYSVDVAEANQAAGTKPISSDMAGLGANPISPNVPISADTPEGGGSSTITTDAGGWISDAFQYNIISKEVPAGSLNGTNKQYVLLNLPAQGSEHVYKNGLLMTAGVDYTIVGGTITFTSAPLGSPAPDKIFVTYIKQATTVPWTASTYLFPTGGTPQCLDWEATVGLATDGSNLRWVNNQTSGAASLWTLAAGTTSASSGIVRPLDFNLSTNAKIWKRVLGL